MERIRLNFVFGEPGYIGNPYWPEMAKLIDIQKRSGMNRAKTDANRRRALEQHLISQGLSYQDYLDLEKLARRPFHMNADGFIYIPATRVTAMMVNAASVAPAALRPCRPDALRSAIKTSDFLTDKKEPTGIFRRFATVTSGTGAKLSNQRGLREDPVISNFVATGEIHHDPEHVSPKDLLTFLRYAGREIGVGASRKMGYGRFEIESDGEQS